MLVLWFVTRLIYLPTIIYTIMTEFRCAPELSHFDHFINLNVVFLSILFLLHSHWFVLFIQMIIHLVKTGSAEDLQSKVQSKKDKDE